MFGITPNSLGSVNIGPMTDEILPDRLEKIRLILKKDSHAALARSLKIGTTAWNNYMRGYPLPLNSAQKIKRAIPGMTLDWIVDGDPDKLPLDLAGELGEAPKPNAPPSRGGKSSGRR